MSNTAEIQEPLGALRDGGPALKVLAVARSDVARNELIRVKETLQNLSLDIVTIRPAGVPAVDLIVVEADLASAKDLALIGELKALCGETGPSLVALAAAVSPQDVLAAIRSGADDVLSRPIDARELRGVLDRVSGRKGEMKPSTGALGRILTFAHVCGGAGATTLAVNAAISIARATRGADVCLIDFDIQFGSVASLLDLPPASPMQDLVRDPARLDREMLENMMVRHESGIHVLTAPRLPLPLDALDASVVADILDMARRHYRYVIVDLPHALTAWSEAVFRKSNAVYIVTQLNVPSIHQMKKLFDLVIEEHLDDLPFKIVINRHQGAMGKAAEISSTQLERAIGRRADYTIPNDYELIAGSRNQGKPATAISRTSRFSVRLGSMLNDTLQVEGLGPSPAKTGLAGIPLRLFGG